MVFPLFKVLVVVIKTTSKPFANFLKILLRNQMMMQGWFVYVGNKANEFEARVNFKAANPNIKATKDKLEMPDLTQDQAFMKGVEYTVELLVLYGLIGAVSIYEIKKSINSQKKLDKQFKQLETY